MKPIEQTVARVGSVGAAHSLLPLSVAAGATCFSVGRISSARRQPIASQPVRLCFVGDLMLGRGISKLATKRPAADFWSDTVSLLAGSDAVIANLESPITSYEGRWSECWKAFRFAADPKVIDILTEGNVRAVNLANNHMLDCEAQGLKDTIRHLDAANISHAGAGLDLAAAWRPTLFRAGPLTVGLIGTTSRMREFAARHDSPGTALLSMSAQPSTLALIGKMASELRVAGAATVVLSVHWGPDMKTWPSARFRSFARGAIKAGVDIVHGHSAHVIQGVEAYDGGLILYDTGNFLDDYLYHPGLRLDQSFAFVVEYRDGRPERLDLIPVQISQGRVSLAKGHEFRKILRKMTRRSARLGTDLRETNTGLFLDVARRPGKHHDSEPEPVTVWSAQQTHRPSNRGAVQ